MEDNKLIKDRIEKLGQIREMGVEPYPYTFDHKNNSTDIKEKNADLKSEEHSKSKVSIAGRLMQIRKMGKASFAHIQDEKGRLQIYLTKDTLKDNYALFKKLDIGDIVGVKGTIFKTKTGEVTVDVNDFTLLCKSLRPFPEKYHGLKDDELRYRKRYLDLIMNPEVKEVFVKKIKIKQEIRTFLDKKGFLEMDTPILQTQYGGANARPFETHINAWDMSMYLKIAPELYLKRLLVGGFEKVYDLNYNFRNEGADKTHNPEFMMVEYYWAYADREQIMQLTEELWESVAIKVNGTTKILVEGKDIDLKRPWKRMTMKEAVKEYANIDMDNANDQEIQDFMRGNNIEYTGDYSKNMAITLIFEELCEDKLINPTHILDHPKDTTPLCKKTKYDDEFVERTEFYVNGWECGNGYSELNDPILQKQLLIEQAEKGRGGDEEAHPMDDDFIEAMEYGMPPAGGLGFGVDRMAILLTGANSIRDVIMFPTMKPHKKADNSDVANAGITLKEAHKLLAKHVKNENLTKHCLASAAVLKALAKKLNKNEEAWEIAGLLHDLDFETHKEPTTHGKKTTEILKENKIDEKIIHAIAAHNPEGTGVKPETELDFALSSGESITGLIVATALIYPDKILEAVKPKSVKKRIKEKSFARQVNRECIMLAEKLNITIDEFVELALKAMQDIHKELGL